MNYLTQYINESQLLYPNIFKTPISVMRHLLFTIGNGVDFIEGDPCIIANFNKTIYFKDYYRDAKSFKECFDYYKKYNFDREVEEELVRIKNLNSEIAALGLDIKKKDKELYEEAFDNINATLSNIQPVIVDFLLNTDYWYQQITYQDYLPLLKLSSYYSNATRVTSNTDRLLLECTIAIIKAYLKFFKEFNDDMLVKYEYPYGCFIDNSCTTHKDSIYKTFKEDIAILEEHLLEISAIN